MANIDWAKVIAFVLRMIADGLDPKDAIAKASVKFNVPKSAIKAKM